MIRILIIGIACTLGIAAAWVFIPTASFAPASMESAADDTAGSDKKIKSPRMSDAVRAARAEQLVGNSFSYITRDDSRSVSWFRSQSEHVLDQALDECYLLTHLDLYLEHVDALADGQDMDDAENNPTKVINKYRPTMTQMSSCANAKIVYNEQHEG